MEIHKDSIVKNDFVLLIDDLIATGGTAEAAAKLVEKSEGKVAGFLFVSTGLAYDAFGTPRPDTYFQASETKAPVVSERFDSKAQLDLRLK